MPQRDAARTTSATARSAVRAAPATTPPAPAASGAPAAPVTPPPAGPPVGDAAAPPPDGASSDAPGGAPASAPDGSPPDARAAARATLAAGRSPSLWWVCSGVVVALLVTGLVGPSAGGTVLAGLLAASAVARAVLRPGPVALTVRSRTVDCAVLAALALGVGLLSHLVPTG